MTRARTLQLSVSLAVGGVCLWLAFRSVNFVEAGAAISRVPWWGHGAYLLALVFQFWVRSVRWALQAEGLAGKKPPLKDSLAINAIGFAAVFLLPLRLGEFVRPYLLAQRGYMSNSAGLATTAVERIIDGLVTTGCFAVVLVLLGDRQLPDEVKLGGWAALGFFGGVSVVLAVAYRFRKASERFWMRAIGLVHEGLARRLVAMLGSFLDGLRCFRSPGAFAGYLLYTLLFWLVNGASMYLMLHLMGSGASLLAAYFTLCFLVIGVMMPAPPGNVGNFHAFAKLGLVLLGIAENTAIAFAIVIHAWQVVGLVLWAGLFVLRGEVSLARVREATQAGEEVLGPTEGVVRP
jgi:glycosyltransferase 2 family protein